MAFPQWGIAFTAAAAVGFALHKVIKAWTRKPRPFEINPEIVCPVRPPDRFSMPSGHCVQAVLFGVFLLCIRANSGGWAAAPVLVWCVSTAWSRVALGLHDTRDVVAGSILGLLLAGPTIFWLVPWVGYWIG